ncbi:ROK family transcriptional regulator [Streptomyces sp. RLB3-17]|uniref:ROK family transcriptional regulator n=1 Tax=Streptomyces TaxID=1883 RepID=UPI00116562D5|nr:MULTISPECIES: ROK family transcriptional regulator [unclassified Streptomyces]NMI63034.1 ROK family transcriptional regulator [Streptomyces sp. RLA2-12]QDN61992.1 ROK family transcriptional regulator [Streptomyces sp. S1D4-20]QDN72044.1 ROK family transcriptional regulator [Streptomyces sp. S1D4-14]QDN82346.1 ROK family transcriptional regulator [Streptomyces sp. S1A1-7]QDO02742.1 ROK family transcriptional regulator [Streptomyces sp. RLB1-9]
MAVRNGRTVRDLRRGNRTAVLQRLYFDGPLSRFELGPATGLSSGSISNVVAELVADGLVEEAGSVDSDGGRPRTLLRVVPGSGHMIGVDVGETRVRVELFDLTLTELARTERPLEQQGYAGDWASEGEGAAQVEGPSLGGGPSSKRREYDVDVIVGHIRDGVAEVLDEAGIAPERLLGVGIGVPGIVARTPEEGAVVHGQTIGWDAVPLESLLRSACQLPDTVPYFADNGARTLGQAEMWFGAGRGARNAVVVLFGSGVGACLVTEDVEHGRSVEWGHLTVRVRGRRCRCGALGCLEAYAGAEALLDRWREEGGRPPEGTDEETALTAMLTAAYPAEEGVEPDPVALAVLEETAEYLGAGLSDLINLFQPERILIGGWAGLQLGTRFLPAVRRYAASYALRYPAERVSIDLGRLGPDAVTVGAAILPLADFFARGGRRAEPVSEGPSPAWRTALEERAPH